MLRFLICVWGTAMICSAQTSTPKPAVQPPASTTVQQPAPKPPASPAAGEPTATDTSATVAPTQAVVTVKGVCTSAPATKISAAAAAKPASAPCQTVVSKAKFEKLLNALGVTNQTIPPARRRNLAQAYVELMAYAQAAEKAGVDKDPKFIELMHLTRMRTLADVYRRGLEEKYRTPPAQEIQAWYTQNLQKYEEIKLSRIFIPAKNTAASAKDDWEKKAVQVANDVHDRAGKGEDLEKLQKEAYTTLGLTISPPSTNVGNRRRGMLAPQEEQELFALKPGDVSKLEQQPAGYIIYKVESRQMLALDQVKDEISRELFRQKMEAGMKSVTNAIQAEYNDQYFGPQAPPPGPAGARVETPPPSAAKPPSPPPPAATTPPTPAPATSTPPAGSAPVPAPPSQKPPE